MKPEAPKSTVATNGGGSLEPPRFQRPALPVFSAADLDESEVSRSNINRTIDGVCDGLFKVTDQRRFAVYLRLIRAADHELEAATRPRERRQPLSQREALPAA